MHAGDFTLRDKKQAEAYIRQLNGNHIFLSGSHDKWLGKGYQLKIWEQQFNKDHIIVCHYAFRTWPRSHYNSWQLYGHSHGRLPPIGKQLDIGVDTNDFYPYSLGAIRQLMKERDDNPGYTIINLKKRKQNESIR